MPIKGLQLEKLSTHLAENARSNFSLDDEILAWIFFFLNLKKPH